MTNWFDPRWLFAVLGSLFIVAGLLALGRGARAQARTWIIVGAIFLLVTAWLWLHR
jgi:uncharacterized membrane protein HdeD (DUF308 family)